MMDGTLGDLPGFVVADRRRRHSSVRVRIGDGGRASFPVQDLLASSLTADMLLQVNVTLSVERACAGRADLTPRRVVRVDGLDVAADRPTTWAA